MSGRVVSLAAGTVLDVDPVRAVDVGAVAGFDAVGIWFDPATWTSQTTAAVASRLAATGMRVLDVEPVILGRGTDAGDAVIDAAAELGAPYVLLASTDERGATAARVAELCERAASANVVVVVEFLPIFTIATLADALAVVDEVGHPNAAVLVDTLHLARSGGSPDDLRDVRHLLPYLQIADAPAEPPARDLASLRHEALHGRLLPGDGELPLRDTLAVVPDVPLSLELRSASLMDSYPDPVERARAVMSATRRLLDA